MSKTPEDINNPYEYSGSTNAFGKFSEVATSFNRGLENSIIELAKSNEKLLMSEVLAKFGNYPATHHSVKKLLLENKLIMYELNEDSYQLKQFETQILKISNTSLSQWVDLAAQPCLTCPIFNECAINNPVSPAKCDEFEAWLQEEIQFEFGKDSFPTK